MRFRQTAFPYVINFSNKACVIVSLMEAENDFNFYDWSMRYANFFNWSICYSNFCN